MPLLLLTQQDYPGAAGTANKTRSTTGQGKDLPCAAYKADEPKMDGSTNTPKDTEPQSASGVSRTDVPSPPALRAAH